MSSLYEQDYAHWAEIMAEKLQQKHFQELDIENLVQEIKDLLKRERDKLLSGIRLVLDHLLKMGLSTVEAFEKVAYYHSERMVRWAIFFLAPHRREQNFVESFN
jgi:hypothetical protein